MRYRMRYCICCMWQMRWKLIRYDCLNVWKQLGISPAGLKISLTCFFTPFASRFFVGTVFFHFHTTEKWEGGLRWQSDVFLHDICKWIFCKNYFSCFRTKKKWEGGLKWQSEVFLPGIKKSARSRTGTRTKTGSASSRNGLFLVRGLTYVCFAPLGNNLSVFNK